MWFLPTRGRPEECRALIDAMERVDDVPEVAVLIDDTRAIYSGVRWPSHWTIRYADEHIEMSRAINLLLGLHPGRKFYGFFGDHFRPQTKWSAPLEDAAGDWLMAWPNDLQSSYRQPSGAPTFGGKLVGCMGWICLPTTVHVCTDRVWWWLWRQLGIAKHVDGVRFTRTWPLGQGSVRRSYRGKDYDSDDFTAWQVWRATQSDALVAKIRTAMIADGYEFTPRGLHPKHGATPFQEGW